MYLKSFFEVWLHPFFWEMNVMAKRLCDVILTGRTRIYGKKESILLKFPESMVFCHIKA